ncbi:MAG: bifunctional NAD(P)H-hydrate repair enzyme Nnr [Candidatus Poribacteria bacterium]|nr:MAG: bifunctional NAD(P)H-hydrate repair enzyme Nnr [Candidatus Poribacteria bacterium]
MRPLLTPEQMRAVDRYTIEELGVPGQVLMEHAGRQLAERIAGKELPRRSVGIVCGKGNNGGDGLVAARFLHVWGYRATVYLTVPPEQLSGDAALSYRLAERFGVPIRSVTTPEALASVPWSAHDWLLDCLLGTGIRGAVRGFAASVIEAMNGSGVPVLACDLPSGLDAERGAVEGPCVRAAETLTIGHAKVGLLLYPGAEYVGEWSVADLGFPPEALDRVGAYCFLLEAEDAARRLPPRPRNAHKGTFGRALIVAGSVGLSGAAALAARSALRVGAGLVTFAVPEAVHPILETLAVEATGLPLPDREGALAPEAEQPLREALRSATAWAIGSGLSQRPGVAFLVRRLLEDRTGLPERVVLDADALNVLAPLEKSGVRFPPGAVLTPHPGEMGRLLARPAQEVDRNRVAIAREFAQEQGVVLILKGVPTVIAAPDGRAFLNPTGNPGMAKGGSGDALTGILVGLLAQGLQPLDAAILGVYLHGMAGDLAARSQGAGLLASELCDAIPAAWGGLRQLQETLTS